MSKGKKNPFQGGPKNILILTLLLVGGILVLHQFTDYARQIKTVPYMPTFLKKVEEGAVKQVHIAGHDVYGTLKDGTRFETVIGDNQKNWDLLEKTGVEVIVASTSNQISLWYLFPFLLLLMTLWGIWYYVRQTRGGGSNSGGGGGNNIFNMGKSRAKMFMPSTIKETFDSVAGNKEAKEELQDVVDYLKNPEKYRRLGAKITRGVLLIGEPGNGKTLLAKAVAGEANCPFFSISGSDFIEVFVGVGAARVRDLFAQARKHAPSIIFIDEIDAVGRHRGSGLGGGHDEREQTLNQLLTEMDGFQTTTGSVIVMAATNRPDVLDKALLRPGRFDRRVEVPYPDLASRDQILRLHAQSVKIDPTINFSKIARGTPGFTGADLANLINEAAINASKFNQDLVTVKDFEEARDKILLGKERKSIILTEEDRTVTAFHEAGHALIALLSPEYSDPLHKITIVPRGSALGLTHYLPEKEKYLRSKEEMLANIDCAMGGRAAEEVVFNKMTTGAYSDFKGATDIARKMVCYYGMSLDLGPVIYGQQNGEYVYSQSTADKIDKEVQKILDDSYQRSVALLKNNRDKLDMLAGALLEKETLQSNEVYELLSITPRTDHTFA